MQKTILLVDDDECLRDCIAELIEAEALGVKLVSFSNGVEALDYLEHHKVDLVLLDLLMPLMTGEQVLVEFERRCKEEYFKTPIIVITACSKAEDMLKNCNVTVVKKPFDVSEFLAQIKEKLCISVANNSHLQP